jgi:hypothetical protein
MYLHAHNFKHICKIFLQLHMCKISNKFVKNESHQTFLNHCKPNLTKYTSKNWLKMIAKKLVPPNDID